MKKLMTEKEIEETLAKLEIFLHVVHTKGTVASYLYYLGHFLRSNPYAKDYVHQEIVHYIATIKERYTGKDGRVTATLNAHVAAIKRFYDYLYQAGYRKDHPCKSIAVKGTRTKGTNFESLFTTEELYSMINARTERYCDLTGLRNQAMISILVMHGPTSEELCNMKVQHIDFDNETIYYPSSLSTASRHLRLTPKQATILYRYIHEARPRLLELYQCDDLFISIRGAKETVDSLYRMLKTLQALFSDKVLNPNNIRKSVISNWINVDKYPLEVVQQMAGHRWPSSTLEYKRADDDKAKEMIDKFHPLG